MTFNYIEYWENTYRANGTSGSGSYGLLAEFKAEIANALVKEYQVQKILEFGCGDGNQLQYMNYPVYLGLDVAPAAVQMCAEKFKNDLAKSFILYKPGVFFNRSFFPADMIVCLDVLYHITDDTDFHHTLNDIMQSSAKLIVLYTKITGNDNPQVIATIKDRDILQHLSFYSNYELKEIIPQRYPEMSSADFIILQKKAAL